MVSQKSVVSTTVGEAVIVGAQETEDTLKAIAKEINEKVLDWLEEIAVDLAEELNRNDRLNVAHNTFIASRRFTSVAVGPSSAGRRAHIVRFHEFGTAHHKATPLMRKYTDDLAGVKMQTKMTKKVKRAIEARQLSS